MHANRNLLKKYYVLSQSTSNGLHGALCVRAIFKSIEEAIKFASRANIYIILEAYELERG